MLVKKEITKRRRWRLLLSFCIALIAVLYWWFGHTESIGNTQTAASTINTESPKNNLVVAETSEGSEPNPSNLANESLTKEQLTKVMQQAFETEGQSLDEDKYPWARCLPDDVFESQEQVTQMLQDRDDYLSSLENSPILDQRLASALFSRRNYQNPNIPKESKNTELSRIINYLDENAPHPLLINKAILLCTNFPVERCNDEFINELVAMDKHNGHTWFNAMTYWASKDNEEEVLNAIEGLSTSIEFNDNPASSIEVYVNAFDKGAYNQSTFGFGQNYISAVGYTAANIMRISQFLKWCDKNSDNPHILERCTEAANQIHARSQSHLTKRISAGMLLRNYEKVGNDDAVEQIKKSSALQDPPLDDKYGAASMMTVIDEKLGRVYIEYMKQNSELEATFSLPTLVEEFYEQDGNVICGSMYELMKKV